MNKNVHRLVFNAARGECMAVQETAKSADKAAGATSAVLGAATAALLALTPAQAQITSDPNAPGNQRPTVLVAPNGVPVINVVTPSAAGVSRNTYRQFDVNAQGAIFNNSRTAVQSQLGGFLAANPWLARGSARVILNEVNSSLPSYLRGPLEVAGPRAEVVIANPSGIQVDGATFINANRVTLTTGVPQVNTYGGIENYRVTGGTIGVSGAGLDASGADFAALYARMVSINAGVWGGGELRVVTGANQVSADGAPGVAANIVPIASIGPTQPLAFDSGLLGGMYSQKIWIMGTEAGVGARNAGTIQTGAGNAALMGVGELTVSASGLLENIGTIQSAGNTVINAPTFANTGKVSSAAGATVTTQSELRNSGMVEGQRIELASAAGDVVNSGALRQTSSAGLTLAAQSLSNTAGGFIGAEPGSAPPAPGDPSADRGDSAGGAGVSDNAPAGSSGAGPGARADADADSSANTPSALAYVPLSPGSIAAPNGRIRNDGGQISTGGPITLQTPQVNNAGGSLSVDALAVTGPAFNNAGGTLNIANSFSANVGTFDNSAGGKLYARSVNVASTGDFNNADGSIQSNAELTLNVGGVASNERGTISTAGALTAAVSGAIQNAAGSLVANQALSIQGQSLDNTLGTISSATAGTSLSVANAIVNSGTIGAAADLSVRARSLANSGILRGGNDTTATVDGELINGGRITAARNTAVGAASLQSGRTSVLGAGVQGDGGLGAAGNLSVTTSGPLVAQGTNVAAGNVTLQGASIDLSTSQTSAANIAIAAAQGNVSSSGATIATAGTLSVSANAQGSSTLMNDGGQLNAAQLDLRASNIVNTNGGEIIQTGKGATMIAVSGTIDNTAARIASNGATTISAASLVNHAGSIRGAGSAALTVATSGLLDNSAQGEIGAGGNVTLNAGSLSNDTGRITAVVNVDATVMGRASNVDGILAANGNTSIAAASLDNSRGTIAAVNGELKVDTIGVTSNAGGTMQAGGNATLANGGLNNVTGKVFGNALAIDTRGNTLTNAQGTLAATTTVAINSGALLNDAGLVRSAGTTTLNAGSIVNTNTSRADQGIEGQNVALNIHDLDNTSGAIRSDVNTTITSGGQVNNTSGLISAGDTLRIADSNAANPIAKQLDIVNTGGTLLANKSLQLDAAKLGFDGTLATGKDLTIQLTQDLVNNGELSVNGNLTYSTTGNLTNNGKLLAGGTLTASGNVVENTATAVMSGSDTRIHAGTLNNRGLIDSRGLTRIDAGTVSNIGTGRIYGDSVAIGASTLNNQADTIGGTGPAGVIAARVDLDIGANTITNRDGALIYSGRDMRIGAALNESGRAVGKGTVLSNLSAEIESTRDMSIAMGTVNNLDSHLVIGQNRTTGPLVETVVTSGGFEAPKSRFILDPDDRHVWYINDDGSLAPMGRGWKEKQRTATTTTDYVVSSAASRLVSGGDMSIDGLLRNHDSKVLAGGRFSSTQPVDNYSSPARKVTSASGWDISISGFDTSGGNDYQARIVEPDKIDSIRLAGLDFKENTKATTGYDAGAATSVTVPGASAAGGVSGRSGPGAVIEVASNVKGSTSAGATDADRNAGGSREIPMVVRTSTPDTRVPSASLFRTRPGPGGYLIETDPRFANYRNWLGSDYLLNALGYDPNSVQKRLGDGFYEQKLIREQIAQLTGYRYLDGYADDEEQYTALINAGVTFARQYDLRPGIALTAAQMAQLTSDIVWLVEQTVTLPDGSTQKVLVPQVYVRVRPGDIDGSGALLSAEKVDIKGAPGAGDLNNTGTMAGRTLVSISADNINNLGGRISGGHVALDARRDIHVIGGEVDARDSLRLAAGNDIHVRTTTNTTQGLQSSATQIDRIAGLYVTNPGGTLIASAGRDVNLEGAVVASEGAVGIGAARNVNVGTVTESSSSAVVFNARNGSSASSSRDVGSAIQGVGTVRMAAGNDLNVKSSSVASVEGALVASAGNDINITAGQATETQTTYSHAESKKLMSRSSATDFSSSSTTDVLSSSLSGSTVTLIAGNDIVAQAAQLSSDGAMALVAGRDISLTTADQITQEANYGNRQKKATGLGMLTGVSLGAGEAGSKFVSGSSGTSISSSTSTQAVGTTVSAGSLQTVSGRDTTLQGATVVTDNDITMLAGRHLTIESARNTSTHSSFEAHGTSGMIGTRTNPSLGNVKSAEAEIGSGVSQSGSQVASLQGNVTLVAGDTYRQTASSVMAAGQAGEWVGGDVNILAKNVAINEAHQTAQAFSATRNASTVVGGSASAGGISTDSLRGAKSTAKAVDDTGDSRMQALGAVNLAMSGKQAYDTAASVATGEGVGYKVSVNLSRNKSESSSTTAASEAVGSSIVGANNVNIVATGGGAASNIHAVGSTITAGNTVNLAAENAITLEASRNTFEHHGSNSSSGASVGVGFAGGSQNGFTIELGVSQGRGKEDAADVSHNNTQVSGAKAVNVASGGDLNIRGGVIDGERVAAVVGGNLNIESLQDTSTQVSKQSSSGANLSLCIPPICYGVSTVGGSSASAKANGDFASVKEQSGIQAGDGGFAVNVKGNTDLKGGVVSSTQDAIDAGKNSIQSASLSTSDIVNHSTSKASGHAVSGSIGVAVGDQGSAASEADRRAAENAQNNARPGGSAGIGSVGSSETSVMKAGISGVAGDESVRTGDAARTGALLKDWNTQNMLKDVQSQVQITQEFGQKAASAWGTYANGKLVEALNGNDAEAAACWGDGGSCRAAGHAVIGGLGGGTAGAAGAGVGAAAVPHIGAAVDQLGLSGAAADAVTAGLAAAVGYAAGDSAGAAGAFNEAANNYLSSGQVREMMGKLRDAPTQSERDKIFRDYAALSAKQSDAITGCAPAECARIAGEIQGGKQALNDAKSELRGLGGESSSYGSILGTQRSDQQFVYGIGNGWVDSNGNSIDVLKQMRADGKEMSDQISRASAYAAAGCAAVAVCMPAVPVIGAVGFTAGLAKDWIFSLNPVASLTDWGVNEAIKWTGDMLKIPAYITTPVSEGLKDSKELSEFKDAWEVKR